MEKALSAFPTLRTKRATARNSLRWRIVLKPFSEPRAWQLLGPGGEVIGCYDSHDVVALRRALSKAA
jgi:hypothetical protein